MSQTAIVMMVLVLGFYGGSFFILVNRAFNSKS